MKLRRLLLLLALGCPLALSAQGSAYVPLDDIAYTYVNALMARGAFRELSALERPFTERALRTAIDSARAGEPGPVIASYLDALYTAVEKYAVRPGDSDTLAAQAFRARGSGDVYLTGQTSARRELMLSDRQRNFRPGGSLRLAMAGGPVVGFVRVLIDSRLNVDPEFTGRKDRKLAGRTEDGYLGGLWKNAELSFGRVGRNWGPPTLDGLMLGDYAYTYDHLYGRIGTDRIHFSTVIARLDNFLLPSGTEIQRYFSIHRLAFSLGNWDFAGSESYVYSGAGRGFDPTLANPFNIYGLTWRNENKDGNLGLGGEMAVRTERFGTFAGQLFIDDLQIDRGCNPACKQPSSYALTLSAEGLPLVGDQRWFASYTRVSNLAYRNKNPNETYSSYGVGLARGFSDYDEMRAGLDLAVIPRTPLRFYLAHRRQGEGSYNIPFPLPADWATTPGIFSGIVMGVTRAAVSGASRWHDFELSGDVGVNHVTNDAHVTGVSHTSFEGRLKLAIEPRWSVIF
ncbi:MAG: capsule assembly Wzi family protein [Gemmatimonadota bacterium]|nr:capsule assembly Wzi family protein [Gemmatimonadota bacterium]